MTPYELSLFIESYTEKRESDLKEQLTLVWLGEYYHRTKRLPKLKDELRRVSGGSGKQEMTTEEMLETVKRLNAEFGGTFVKGGE